MFGTLSPNLISYYSCNTSHTVYSDCHLLHYLTNLVVDSKKQLSRNTSKSSIAQGTVETDNKRRPVLMKKGSQRFEPPPPEPPDPNSGTVLVYHKNTFMCNSVVYALLITKMSMIQLLTVK